MNLSFRVENTTWRQGIIIIIFTVVGIMSALVFAVWWIHGDGEEYVQYKKMQSLSTCNPTKDAQKAIQKDDFRLYITGGLWEKNVPGIGTFSDKYKKSFGYRHFAIITGKSLTKEQLELNSAVLKYMKSYNRIVFNYVGYL